MADLNALYGNGYYEGQIAGSYRSASIFVEYLTNIVSPKSVVDVGCGRGTWLKAFKEAGATRVVGFDGFWNSHDKLVSEYIEFFACDLNRPITSSEYGRFDLAMSLEVAEHLEPTSALTFVESLTSLSDVVLFGAAFTGQGGTNHLNERPHTFWAHHFASLNYIPFDILRPVFWGDSRIDFWYRQNSFLYVRKNSEAFEAITSKRVEPISNLAFMDCIHPDLYHGQGFRQHLRLTMEAFIPAIQKRIVSRLRRHPGPKLQS